ncbi:hypothetical protein [Comamonas sp. JC664]|uniref:hypothetical protein n=1 Tax=Comamonas sp. JC664 TaxID=2801917 RepID=UPI003615375D
MHSPAQLQQGLADEVVRSGQQFEFMVLRALYALGRIDAAQWEALTMPQPLPGRCMVLSMPETVRRRAISSSRPCRVCSPRWRCSMACATAPAGWAAR